MTVRLQSSHGWHTVLEDRKATHAGTNQEAAALLVQSLKGIRALLQSGIYEGLLPAYDCVLEAVIIAALAFLVQQAGGRRTAAEGSE